MAENFAGTFADLVALREVSKNVYETLRNPEKMGNALPIAYGGCTIAVAANAAHQNLPDKYCLYSIMGNYLGPASTELKLRCSVRDVRTTRTFATRQIEVSQIQANGQNRLCMIVLVDFQVAEPASLLVYSQPPSMQYSGPENVPNTLGACQALLDAGKISNGVAKMYTTAFGLSARLFEARLCTESVWSQNLLGLAKTIKTTQDHLPVTSKTSADWIKVKHAVHGKANQCAAIAFIMDMAISFMPLTFSHMFYDDVSACSSLDFALRICVNNPDTNEFHLREIKTVTGGEGRTYSEARMWDQSGKMVASMTQQSIMRPKPPKKANL